MSASFYIQSARRAPTIAPIKSDEVQGGLRSRQTTGRALFPGDDAEDFGGVAFGSDEGPEFLNFSGFADEERAADDAHESTAHKLFPLPDAELPDGLVSGIAEQGKIEPVLFLERSKRFDGIGAH